MAPLRTWATLSSMLSLLVTSADSSVSVSPTSPTTSSSASSEGTSTVATTTQVMDASFGTFSPFPTPTQIPIPTLFPETDPCDPPSADNPWAIPDFSPAWEAAYQKANNTIANWTLEEKANATTGVGWAKGRCVGNIPLVEDWPGLCLEDSPLGVRFADFVTVFPAGINAAATWNRDLIRKRGVYMGREHVGKGVNIALGPMMNLGRVPEGGRNWEGFGSDPFLVGEAAYETILGLQSAGVQACAKHFINNEQEHSRTSESSNVDDRTQHELYAHPFLRSVMAGVASVMCSYNLINETYACGNDKMLNDILKREFGFRGFVMSDWWAQNSTISAMSGLDMSMPGDTFYDSGTPWFGSHLVAYVLNGTIPLSRVDDMATRILAAWYFLHQDSSSYPPVNFNAFAPNDPNTNAHLDVQEDHHTLVREMGAASIVLLKNTDGALPLRGARSIVLLGSDAGPGTSGPNAFADQGGVDGTLAVGWGSGTANFTYRISPLEAIQRRARQDRTTVSWLLDDFNPFGAGINARYKSAALVFVQSDSGEGYISVDGNLGDRNNLTAWHQGDQLIQSVASQNNNTIVVVHSVGPLIMEPWIDHPNVTAVLWAGLPGTETGNSLADVLFGDWNPSGRLPYTIAKNVQDYPAQVVISDSAIVDIPYSEELLIDYRWFDAKNITPRYEFGYGLSYTTFKYSHLQIERIWNDDGVHSDSEDHWDDGRCGSTTDGSSTALWLHRPLYKVTFDVENTGSMYGSEIPQLYLNMPPSSGEPPSVLRGFTHVELHPDETQRVEIILSRYHLSIWDVVKQCWRRPEGTINVTVGASSRDHRLHGEIRY